MTNAVFKIPNQNPWLKMALPLIRVDLGISNQEIEKIIANILNSFMYRIIFLGKISNTSL